ncbi:MAG: ANTAR domain-containing response regulator [Aristaeellaceae bacterium]
MQESILLVGSTEKSQALLHALVPQGQFGAVSAVRSGGEARRLTQTVDPALVVISAPLSDESGLDLALELAHTHFSGVLLLVKAELAETVAVRVEEYGVLVLGKPVAKPLFDQALRFSLAMRNRMLALREENARLEKKLADTKLIDRAKCMLIQYLGMTEEQAHRQIEKQAMDNRQTKTAVARGILASYEL